jgi:amino acid adenylation domain-containing protein
MRYDSTCVVKIDAGLDVPAALAGIVERHDILSDYSVDTADALPVNRYAGSPGSTLRATVVGEQVMLSAPASCADATSMRILARELAAAPDDEVMQYDQYAAWQEALLEEDDAWHHPRTQPRALPFERAHEGVTRSETGRLANAASADFLLACWLVLLWQQSRGADAEVGVVSDGRIYQELESVVGPCTKALPVVMQLAETDRFVDVLGRVQKAVGSVREAQEYFDPARSVAPMWGFEFAADESDVVAWTGQFSVKLHCWGQSVRIEYQDGRFSTDLIQCLLEQFEALTESAVRVPEAAIGTLSALGPEQSRRIAGFARTAEQFPEEAPFQLFETQAAKEPDRLAVNDVTYGELNARANQLAWHLRELGAAREVPVGICLERGTDMVVAVLAVHKAGAAYVPLDPANPADRIRAIVDDTGLPIVITQGQAAHRLPSGDWQTVRVGDTSGHSTDNPGIPVDAQQLAYILHTSGSTGRPKGVRVSQRAFGNFLHSMRAEPGIGQDDNLVAVTTLSFDIAGLELFLPLTAGARVTVADTRTASDPKALSRLLETATVLQATPVTWRMLIANGWHGNKNLTALVGGEAVPPELVARLSPLVRAVWNMYGPTETTIWSTCAKLDAQVAVTVGKPIANTCVHVLDRDLTPVPVGMLGEVYIGGTGVAQGYVGRPGLTAERFVPDPVCGGRMYQTGDLARYDPAGNLYVTGRADSQVKIRGFRIELGEVETVLAKHPAVQLAVATTRPEPSGEQRLDAYVLPLPGARPSPHELRDYLKEKLPAQMVPARIGVVTELPMTPNGKVDRAALPEIALEVPAEHVPASTERERAIVEVWRDVLGVEPGVTDNFFDLGGHSVLLAQASNELRQRFGWEITPLTLLEHPTIASLAQHLDGAVTTVEVVSTGGRGRLRQRRQRVEDQ